jgi:hypothetical protein
MGCSLAAHDPGGMLKNLSVTESRMMYKQPLGGHHPATWFDECSYWRDTSLHTSAKALVKLIYSEFLV